MVMGSAVDVFTTTRTFTNEFGIQAGLDASKSITFVFKVRDAAMATR
jgi:hypothetical protein